MICACKRDDGKCGDARIVDGRIVCGLMPAEFRSRVCACGTAGRCMDAKIAGDSLLCNRLAEALSVAEACGWKPAKAARRQGRLSEAVKTAAVHRVLSGEAQGAVAADLGLTASTVRRWCDRAGVRSRFKFAGGREDLRIKAEIAREKAAASAEGGNDG